MEDAGGAGAEEEGHEAWPRGFGWSLKRWENSSCNGCLS